MARGRLTVDLLAPTVETGDEEESAPPARAPIAAAPTPPQAEPTQAVASVEASAAARGRRLTRASELGPSLRASGRPPAPDLADVKPVAITCYVRPDQLKGVRAIATKRRESGKRSDVSMVIREAIDQYLAVNPTKRQRS